MYYHLCSCSFCDKKSTCAICGSDKGLHRAHIVPRHIISLLLEESEEKRAWLSFEGPNVFALCKIHHGQYDGFRLRGFNDIRWLIELKLEDFMDFITGKHIDEEGKKKLDRWIKRTNDFIFNGGEVLSFSYENRT